MIQNIHLKKLLLIVIANPAGSLGRCVKRSPARETIPKSMQCVSLGRDGFVALALASPASPRRLFSFFKYILTHALTQNSHSFTLTYGYIKIFI